eukprot:1833939-Prymnesium_polylepis.2
MGESPRRIGVGVCPRDRSWTGGMVRGIQVCIVRTAISDVLVGPGSATCRIGSAADCGLSGAGWTLLGVHGLPSALVSSSELSPPGKWN